MPSSNTRIEHDLPGDLAVTAEAYFELVRKKHILTDQRIGETLTPEASTASGR
jgi:hypothetical protein